MTLQRINRILLRDFGRWRGEHEFTFEGNRTVLAGPNGTGKSTIWNATVLGLLFKTTNAAVAAAFTPIGGGGGDPYVEIDFVAAGTEFRIEKTFRRTGGASRFLDLSVQPARVVEEGDNGVIACRAALTGAEDDDIIRTKPGDVESALSNALDGQVIDLIMPRQGKLSTRYGGNESLQRIGLEPIAEDADRALRALISYAENDLTEVRTSETARATGKLPTARGELESALTEEQRLQEISNNLLDWLHELGDLQVEVAEEPEVDETEAMIEQLLEEAQSHQANREEAEAQLNECRQQHTDLEALQEFRTGLRQLIQQLSDDVNTLTTRVESDQDRLATETERLESRRTSRNEIQTSALRFREWLRFVERTDSITTMTQELDRLEIDSQTYSELIDDAAEKRTEIDSLVLASDEQWRRLREIQGDVASIRGAADAWSVTQFSPGPDHVITVDDEQTDDSPSSVSTSIQMSDGVGDIRLRVENTRSLDEINSLLSEEAEIFSLLSADGTSDLNQRKTRFDALTAQESRVNDRIQDLDGRLSNEDRTERIADLRATLGRTVEEPDSERPSDDENWTERLVELEADLKTADEAVEESRVEVENRGNTLTESQTLMGTKATDLQAKQEEVDAHVNEYGTDTEIVNSLAIASVRLEEAINSARPLIESRAEEEEQKRQRATTLQTTITDGRATRRRIAELRSLIREKRVNGGLENLGRIRAERGHAEERVAQLEIEQNALCALLIAFNTVREANIEEIRPRVIDTIRRGASYVFAEPDLQVELGDDGFPTAVQRVLGQTIPFERESFGTQEQLNLIYRIAIAGIIAEERGHGLCIILDDPFGQTDVHRRGRMLEWIGARLDAADHQLILFTCRGGDFEGFGTHDDVRRH